MMKNLDLSDRLIDFTANAALLCKGLPNGMIGFYYADQLLWSRRSAALNFGEAQGTNSDRHYINKAGTSLKKLEKINGHLKILRKFD